MARRFFLLLILLQFGWTGSLWMHSGWMGSAHASTSNRSYSIPDISVHARIDSLGRIHIAESRTYVFEGSYSWADYRLPRRGFDRATAVRVSEGDHWYMNDESETPGTFSVSQSDREMIVRWNYAATDTQRTFTVHYELEGALADGPEFTEFYWNWLDAGREKPTDRFTLHLELPGQHSDSVHVWVRLPEERYSLHIDNATLSLEAHTLSTRTSVLTRLLFPTQWLVPQARPGTAPDLSLQTVEQQERQRIEEQREREERQQWYRERAGVFNGVLIALSLGIFVLMYQRYGKRYRPTQSELEPLGALPDTLSPPLAGALLFSGVIQPVHLLGSLFDLARRGWLVIREQKKEKTASWFESSKPKFFIEKADSVPQEALQPFEKILLEHLYTQMQAGKNRLDKLMQKELAPSGKVYIRWYKAVQLAYKALGYADPSNRKAIATHVALQLPLFLLSLWFLIQGGPSILPALFLTGAMLMATLFLYRRTPAGQTAYLRWKAYYKALRRQDPAVLASGSIEQHFVYATTFSIPSKGVSRLITQAETQGLQPVFLWLILMPGSTRSPAQVAESLSTLHSTGTTTFSGSVGGSGASAGSAGGGARGGAG